MGTILASAILAKASIILQDTTNVRWPQAELLGWLSDGQREVCAVLPELTAIIGNITLVAGTKQSLPAGGIALLGDMRNMGTGATPGLAVRKVPREILDSQVPDWHSQTAQAVTKHFTYDNRAPRNFYVYPPAIAANVLEGLYTLSPPDLATVGTAISIDDIYATMLLDYVLYRAYAKDLEMAGNAERAIAFHTNFNDALARKKGVDTNLQPADELKG